jgi:hypothetical protein
MLEDLIGAIKLWSKPLIVVWLAGGLLYGCKQRNTSSPFQNYVKRNVDNLYFI